MPILPPHAFEVFSHSPEQTRRVGIRLGSLLQVGDIVCLEGDLGSGKTTLVQGITQGWGSPSKVTSPTYVIVNEYAGREATRFSIATLTDCSPIIPSTAPFSTWTVYLPMECW